jgi:putative hydrolase of the HAD superfamily
MAKNLIFDFGAVLLPIDESLTRQAFNNLGAKETLLQQQQLFADYEVGNLSSDEFLEKVRAHFFRKKILKTDLAAAWSAMCHSAITPESIKLLKALKKKEHKLFLLSNTNALHIKKIKSLSGPFSYKQFTKLFNQVYYSHEMGLRKPDAAIFETLLKEQNIKAKDCFFVDDKAENVNAASKLGMHTMLYKPYEHSLKDLRKHIAHLD